MLYLYTTQNITMPPKVNATDRPTFLFNNNNDMPVKAGGVIFYRFIDSDMELLLIENEGIYEDLGGRTDNKDNDIYETVAREVYEESNGKFKKAKVEKYIRNANNHTYVSRSKYIIFLIEASEKESKYTTADFGDREIHDNIPRKIKWISLELFLKQEIIRHKLNWRLKNKNLFDMLKKIKKSNETLNLSSDSFTSKNDTVKKPKKVK